MSEAALEGTCASWLAELVLKGEYQTCEELIGQTDENGWEVDLAMAHYVQGYVDKIREIAGPTGRIYVESRVRFNEHVAGDVDAMIVNGSHVTIIDLKYGYKIVEPHAPQLVIYGQSVAQDESVESVTMSIYQPRAFHRDGIYRTWTPSLSDLNQIAQDYHRASYEATATHPQAVPGEHCKTCPVNGNCSALTRELYEIWTMMGGRAARPMNPEELSAELEFAKRAEDMIVAHRKSIEAEAVARLESGKFVPGWTREQGYGNRRWKHDRDYIKMFTGGFDPAGDSMITPAEAERQGLHPEIVNMLTETPRTKARLKKLTKEDIAKRFKT